MAKVAVTWEMCGYVDVPDAKTTEEAMKMFNEIKAETSGTVAEICVDNGNVVEYGQTLFKITMD